jgi:hypothetical protein
LPPIYGKDYPPEVNRVQIVDHVVVNGKVFINISWTFKASSEFLRVNDHCTIMPTAMLSGL